MKQKKQKSAGKILALITVLVMMAMPVLAAQASNSSLKSGGQAEQEGQNGEAADDNNEQDEQLEQEGQYGDATDDNNAQDSQTAASLAGDGVQMQYGQVMDIEGAGSLTAMDPATTVVLLTQEDVRALLSGLNPGAALEPVIFNGLYQYTDGDNTVLLYEVLVTSSNGEPVARWIDANTGAEFTVPDGYTAAVREALIR